MLTAIVLGLLVVLGFWVALGAIQRRPGTPRGAGLRAMLDFEQAGLGLGMAGGIGRYEIPVLLAGGLPLAGTTRAAARQPRRWEWMAVPRSRRGRCGSAGDCPPTLRPMPPHGHGPAGSGTPRSRG